MMDLLSSRSLRHIVHPPDRADARLLLARCLPPAALSCNSRIAEDRGSIGVWKAGEGVERGARARA